jgi:hypothetical protein
MNSLAHMKCARRLLMALAAISGIFLAAGCGSSNSTNPNNGGFSNSSLNGTYVFSTSGTDANGDPLFLAGALTANGTGGISGGTIDVVDPEISTIPSPVAQPITGGSYSIGTDGRGTIGLASSYGTFTLDVVLSSTSGGLVSEFDTNGTGSGTISLQTALTGISQLAGPYAFSVAGADSNANPLASAGSFTLNSSGTSTAGVVDFNDGGIPLLKEALTAVATLGTGTGPGSIVLTSSSFPGQFDFYPIDATHMKFIETDYNEFLAGDAYTQTGAAIPTGTVVFTMSGGTSSSVIAAGGLATSDGTGNFTNGLEDVNNNGTVPGTQVPFSGIAAPGGSVGGRVVVNLTGFVPATQWVIYPSGGGLLLLETDEESVTAGAAFAQTATSFAAQGYGLNLTGLNSNGPVDYIAQFNATSPTSSPNVSGLLDDNEYANPISRLPLSGTYTPDSPATGRGSLSAPTSGSLGTFIGALNLEYYVVDGSNIIFVDLDSTALDAGQVAVGSFQAQSSSSAGAAARSRVSLVHSVVAPHAAHKAHGALQRK